jgi:hypothetical protein
MAAAIIFPIERRIFLSREQDFRQSRRTAPERHTHAELFLLTTQLTDILGICPASIGEERRCERSSVSGALCRSLPINDLLAAIQGR